MYCQNCGSVLSQDARFCQSCGKPQTLPQTPSPPPMIPAPIARTIQPQIKPKSKIFGIVGGVILPVVIVSILGKSPSTTPGLMAVENLDHHRTRTDPTGSTVQDSHSERTFVPSEDGSQAGRDPDQIEEGLRHSRAIPEPPRGCTGKEPDNEADQSAALG